MWQKIESFIEQHRNELDVEEPRAELWQKIESKMDKLDRSNKIAFKPHFFMEHPYWKVAAIILLTIAICFVFFKQGHMLQSGNMVSNVSGLKYHSNHALVHAELAEMESHYNKKIDELFDQVNKYALEDYSFSTTYMTDLQKTESAYLVLRKEFDRRRNE